MAPNFFSATHSMYCILKHLHIPTFLPLHNIIQVTKVIIYIQTE